MRVVENPLPHAWRLARRLKTKHAPIVERIKRSMRTRTRFFLEPNAEADPLLPPCDSS